jgi:hypothetical protein
MALSNSVECTISNKELEVRYVQLQRAQCIVRMIAQMNSPVSIVGVVLEWTFLNTNFKIKLKV